ncbi:acyltransferase family protein [Protaetiibacter larvae]|uniref:Acyltransferase n=1 Tax=Protaetiibacter larvae TaxID=2592654 RepID=A0A5C1Y5N4_9MICO|nr:acyltransferase family protein [Protaetiibacter larvae]QEO08619.1 acyltransferase [Protaetiibacter larvae]
MSGALTAATTTVARPPGTRPAEYRRDIQYLRALAVGLVVLYHFWPGRIPGGFVGVDVFFVISGYLITAHLIAGLARTGRVAVFSFWGRRVRRLLPASFATLAVAAIMVVIWIPPSVRAQGLREVIASTFYVENWILAADSVDYLNAANQPSIVQHFWSLSVEEQFYLVWPLLLVAAVGIAGLLLRRRVAAPESVVSVALVIVAAASLVTSVILTETEPSVAYFATTTRAWEFAAGGLIASLAVLRGGPRGILARRGARWGARIVGIALVLVSGFVYTGATPFPGWAAALPVLGTAIAIWAGIGAESAHRSRHDPIEIIGDRSYSIYLWHWPLLIVAPFALGHALGALDKVLLLVAVVVLAGLSKRWIEDPVRRWQWLGARPARTFVALGIATALLVGAVGTTSWVLLRSSSPAAETSTAEIDAGISCFASDALVSADRCANPFAADRVDTAWAKDDRDAYCIDVPAAAQLGCPLGGPEDAEHTLALVGDSHGASVGQLVLASLPPGWRLISYLATGCPGITRVDIGAPGQGEADRRVCAEWSTRVLDDLESREDVDAVLFTNFTTRYTDPASEMPLTESAIVESWSRLQAAGKTVIALRDIPGTTAGDIPACIDASNGIDDPCTTPRADALPADVLAAAARASGAGYVDLSDRFCDAERCHAVIGEVIVYSDDNHVTRTFARSLRPELLAALATMLPPN